MLFLSVPGCQSGSKAPDYYTESWIGTGIEYYDLTFTMDPENRTFHSSQRITISGDLAEGRKLTIFLGQNLIIENLSLEENNGSPLPIEEWKIVDTSTIDYWWGHFTLNEIEILAEKFIPIEDVLIVEVDYHLAENDLQQGLPDNIYSLFVSPDGTHAGGPESGAFLMVSGSLEAPFRMTITHPDTFECAAPGKQTHRSNTSGFITVTYESDIPYDPSFSCAPYTVLEKQAGDIRIVMYSPPHFDISPDMLDRAAAILTFYQDSFGKPVSESFRILMMDLKEEGGGGESNGNIILLGDYRPFLDFSTDEEAQEIFDHLIAHEAYHLWNAWSIRWEGSLAEWWVEGGANFMASWAKESLNGIDSGAANRLHHITSFSDEMAYNHNNSLSGLDETWFDDWSLVYNYGALVWEQLRQKIGSDTLSASLRDFYENYSGQTVYSDMFFKTLQNHTSVDVRDYLDQWITQNARIDLFIQDVTVQQINQGYQVQVVIVMEANAEFDVLTSLGYKTGSSETWQTIPLSLSDRLVTIQFETPEKPLEMLIDPEYRVPQINPENNLWTQEADTLLQSTPE